MHMVGLRRGAPLWQTMLVQPRPCRIRHVLQYSLTMLVPCTTSATVCVCSVLAHGPQISCRPGHNCIALYRFKNKLAKYALQPQVQRLVAFTPLHSGRHKSCAACASSRRDIAVEHAPFYHLWQASPPPLGVELQVTVRKLFTWHRNSILEM